MAIRVNLVKASFLKKLLKGYKKKDNFLASHGLLQVDSLDT